MTKTTLKKQIVLGLLLGATAACQPPKPVIEGEIAGLEGDKVYLWEAGSRTPADSATVTNSHFRFESPALKGQLIYIGTKEKTASFFWVPGHTTLKLSVEGEKLNADVDGSDEHRKFMSYTDFNNQVNDSLLLDSVYNSIGAAKNAGNDSLAETLSARYRDLLAQYWVKVNAETDRLVAANRDNAFGLYLYYRRHVYYQNFWSTEKIDSVRTEYRNFGPKALESAYPEKIEQWIKPFENTVIGRPAPDISGTCENGDTLKLSALKGKYVLVDFWASWCYWCRLETPNIKKAVAMFPADQFEVLGVSFDSKHEAWIDAIKEDQSHWKQLITTADERGRIKEEYAFSGIPHIMLVDPEGKIVARDLRGEQIIQAISKHLTPAADETNKN